MEIVIGNHVVKFHFKVKQRIAYERINNKQTLTHSHSIRLKQTHNKEKNMER